MSQGIGYVIAALGPLVVGALHDVTHGWSVPAVFLIAVSLAMLLPGFGAGRARTIGAVDTPDGQRAAAR
jgi:CP family cyanate transporter-like MFS transporter